MPASVLVDTVGSAMPMPRPGKAPGLAFAMSARRVISA